MSNNGFDITRFKSAVPPTTLGSSQRSRESDAPVEVAGSMSRRGEGAQSTDRGPAAPTGDAHHFAATYPEARAKFLDAVGRTAAVVRSYRHPGLGPEGEPLFLDIAQLGASEARAVVLVVAGTH